MRKLHAVVLATVTALPLLVTAQPPPPRHPNLETAQKHVQRASDALVKAQKANEYDLGGHAQKARDLLAAASSEINAAMAVANVPDHR
jgi:hypothetical protein